MGTLRKEVLNCFKKLHRARKAVFSGDERALAEVKKHINVEFRKNMHEIDPTKIKQFIKLGHDVEHELRTTVIQAVEVRPNVFEAKIRPDTLKLDNVPYNEKAVINPDSPNKCC